MNFKIIEVDSPDYEKMIELRMKVLLDPIGIPRSYINPEKERNDILIALFNQDKVMGCCILTPVENKTVQLRQMAVLQDFQNKGIGKSILNFAEEEARKRGFQKVILHARETVIPFYQKCQYQIFDRGFIEVNIPHQKMKKEL